MSRKKRQDITQVVDEKLCHSCGACYASCGHDSISYSETVGGYLFPNIDYESCTNCGLCYDVCPGDHFTDYLKLQTTQDPFIGTILSTQVGKANDNDFFVNSQSGGAIAGLLQSLLDTQQISAAVVVGMQTVDAPRSTVMLVKTKEEILSAQKSKYSPTSILALIPKLLKIEGKIAIVGLGCHIHGLENSLKVHKRLKDKIIKIGLICDRVMTTTAIDFLSQQATSKKVDKFIFRDKYNTSYPGDVTVKEQDGTLQILPSQNRMLMKDFFTPARCLLCFDKMNIYADIVVGDPHGVSDVDKVNGESLVIVRTGLGSQLIKNAVDSDYLSLRDASEKEAIKGQDINGKKRKWSANITMWKQMGRAIPDYPDEVLNNIVDVSDSELKKAESKIKQALLLDKYDSKEALLKAASKYFAEEVHKYNLLKPARIVKQIIKKILRK
ncbi:MAG: Coenzyme F420 hydrogenase/dehydrogenase, beta subunit C-terminal domain [Campylobacterota bacterium]|nr:Coenzyme F420 hydrogenase/dehydrogenase, beta subunit C-terminal domain [Campylobacterota bacterium]